ncbi:MAG: hypothetical protein H7Z12_19170 [Rhodospirillaceae bacterium]|nr:hypothetical protein [Rhodospirillales bacterium]
MNSICAELVRWAGGDVVDVGRRDCRIDGLVGTILADKPIKRSPWNMLQKIVQNAILVPHGVDPFRVQETRKTSEHE